MSSTKPLIAVTGASGAQGGSVVHFLLEDGGFRIRGITRNVDSPKAKELAAKGVEVVRADFDDVPSVAKAFDGAYGVFGVTNFWEHANGEKETRQGKVLVDAAKAAGVKHFVWSTLNHTDDGPIVPHWKSKALVDDYLKESGVPRTSLYTAFYYENFVGFPAFELKKADDGSYIAEWPFLWTDGPIGVYSVAETGAYVLEAFKKPDEWIGKDLRVQSEVITPRQYVKALSEVTGKEIKLTEVSFEAFDALKDAPGAYELWANNRYFYNHKGRPDRDEELTARIYPQRKLLREWVVANADTLLPK